MAKLTIFDIVALAKAGYKAADIKELTELEVEGSENVPEDKPANNTDTQPPAENKPEEDLKDKAGDQTGDDTIDYKKLYEEKCEELKTAQQANVHQNQPNETNKQTIDDIVRNFM